MQFQKSSDLYRSFQKISDHSWPYQEKPDLLPKEDYDEIHGTIVKRVLSTNDEKKWNTIPKTYSEIDTLRNKFRKDKEKLKALEEINLYIEEIEQMYQKGS